MSIVKLFGQAQTYSVSDYKIKNITFRNRTLPVPGQNPFLPMIQPFHKSPANITMVFFF